MNHQNQFVPKAVLTRTGKIPVNTARTSSTNTINTARHNFNSQVVPINATRKVNTVKPIVNNARPKAGFHKSVSPFRKSFIRTTALRTNFSKQTVNIAEVNVVSAIKGKRETAVKSSAGCNWRPKRHYWHKVSKYNGGSSLRIVFPLMFHSTRLNKAYLAEYQDYMGGPVAFGGSKGYITGKGKIKTRKLDFEDVCFVKELQHFNLFSVSQMCDKKNKVLFTDSEYSMNYQPVRSENQANKHARSTKKLNQYMHVQKDNIDSRKLENKMGLQNNKKGERVLWIEIRQGLCSYKVYRPNNPKKVYKVVKALYGLHQAPRAWYATLSTFLLKNGYRRGTIDKTLFIKKDKHDIMLVQVYVDDIIFGSTKRSWCDKFKALMNSRFQMSSTGELIFFLGLQVKQKKDGIFISQDKYVAQKSLKEDLICMCNDCSTPIET
ncbi:ribonuclease H-like domain-containing protein [Tanacetum coccineum]